MDYICREAVRLGADPIRTVQVACHHAARYFLLNNRGAIAPGYLADFAVVDNLQNLGVLEVYKRGVRVYGDGELVPVEEPDIPDRLARQAEDTFHVKRLEPADFAEWRPRGVIGMVAGQIITTDQGYADGVNLDTDTLKMAVVERHRNTGHIGIGYLRGYGLKEGAVATSVAHDSHNIIVVGANDRDMAFAANRIAENHGGIVVVKNGEVLAELPLEIAGLMSRRPLTEVNALLENAKEAAHSLGVGEGIDPFMTLSFMSLPVIPTLRLTTRGVMDVATQKYI
jgi:adenine deaminase